MADAAERPVLFLSCEHYGIEELTKWIVVKILVSNHGNGIAFNVRVTPDRSFQVHEDVSVSSDGRSIVFGDVMPDGKAEKEITLTSTDERAVNELTLTCENTDIWGARYVTRYEAATDKCTHPEIASTTAMTSSNQGA